MANDEGDWKHSGRPTSMIARNFSADLNDAFRDSSLDGLVQSVQSKKEAVDSQTRELQALEARLRDTEERLKAKDPFSAGRNNSNSPLNRRQPLDNSFITQENDPLKNSTTSQAPTSVSASTMSRWRPS